MAARDRQQPRLARGDQASRLQPTTSGVAPKVGQLQVSIETAFKRDILPAMRSNVCVGSKCLAALQLCHC